MAEGNEQTILKAVKWYDEAMQLVQPYDIEILVNMWNDEVEAK